MIRSSGSQFRLLEIRFPLSFYEDWKIGFPEGKMPPSFLRKLFLACKNCKRLGDDLHLKEADKEFTIGSFVKNGKKREVRVS